MLEARARIRAGASTRWRRAAAVALAFAGCGGTDDAGDAAVPDAAAVDLAAGGCDPGCDDAGGDDLAGDDLARRDGGQADGGSDGGWVFTAITDRAGIGWRNYPANGGATITVYDHGMGLAAGDFDGDGHADLLLLSQCGPSGYFLGHGDGTFDDRSDRVKALDDGIRVGVAYGDYDNDGDVDFYVTRVGSPCRLLRQEKDGSFTDVSAAAGVDLSGHYSGAAFFDVDNDGDLDLIVAGNLQYTVAQIIPGGPMCPKEGVRQALGPGMLLGGKAPSDPTALFINKGPNAGFTFENQAVLRGIPPGGAGNDALGFGDVAVADFDKDGHVDVLLTEMFAGRTAVLKNRGDGSFLPVTGGLVPRASYGAPSSAWADFTGDGWLDIYMVDMHSDMWVAAGMDFSKIDPTLRYRGAAGPLMGVGDNPMGPLYGNSFWASNGAATMLVEREAQWGSETFQPWGVLAADFDNDGDLDAFIPSGMGNPYDFWPNAFLENRGDHFVPRQRELGFDPPPEGRFDPNVKINGQPYVSAARAAVAADFDEDGDLDLAVLVWNHTIDLLRNDLPSGLARGRHFLDVRPVGKVLRDPYGVWVEVKAGGKTWARPMDGSRSYLSQSPPWIHFGLGALAQVDSVTVTWLDGTKTTVAAPAVDRRLIVQQN